MAWYIDADKLRSRIKAAARANGGGEIDYASGVKVLAMIGSMPTADVVPRGEVRRLNRENKALIDNKEQITSKVKAEVEREIGEEIYRILAKGDNESWICLLIRRLADKLTAQAKENAETCAICGEVIPEGRQVCPTCECIKLKLKDWR